MPRLVEQLEALVREVGIECECRVGVGLADGREGDGIDKAHQPCFRSVGPFAEITHE